LYYLTPFKPKENRI